MIAMVYAGTGTAAARIAGRDPEMDHQAERMKAAIEREAAPHRRTGRYSGKVKVRRLRGKRGVSDRLVFVDHPAAVHIEWGHAVSGSYAPAMGPARWVPGLRIVSRALRKMT